MSVGTDKAAGAGALSGPDDFAAIAAAWFRDLQGRICAAFESFEPVSRFEPRSWSKPPGHRLQGGGESRLMRGDVFTEDVINTWISYKQKNEVDAMALRPHPYEFCLYYDM